jgi:hypothetical protein
VSKPGLYLDENVSGQLDHALRASGYDVWMTDRLGRKGASDVDQLSFASANRWIVVTYDVRHFELLHEAWHRWSHDWGVADSALHAGILLLPDPGFFPIVDAARAVDALLQIYPAIDNRLFVLTPRSGWQEIVT